MVSADKMMNRAVGPVWHPKQKNVGIVPQKLRNLDRTATWSFSYADGWVYGHGSFCLVAHGIPMLGLFIWMPNSAHEGKRLLPELLPFCRHLKTVLMDSKADDQALHWTLRDDYQIELISPPRPGMNKSWGRRYLIEKMWTPANQELYKQRAITVEPMQGLVKGLFDLEHCWMRGDTNNRWLFAAMGVAVQMAQRIAWQQKHSTWNIRKFVLGD